MIECSEENAALFSKLSVFAGNLEIRTDEAHGRDTAEADDDLRLDQLRLRAQEADTRILLGLHRVAVFGRAALDDVRDIAVFPAKVDDGEHFVKKLSSRADKRLALQVLVFSRPSPTNMTSASRGRRRKRRCAASATTDSWCRTGRQPEAIPSSACDCPPLLSFQFVKRQVVAFAETAAAIFQRTAALLHAHAAVARLRS